MVRINLIHPKPLADQHLLAEWNEILMALGQFIKYPNYNNIPDTYCLGKGHISFFKNKIGYLYARLWMLYAEMKNRGMKPDFNKIDYYVNKAIGAFEEETKKEYRIDTWEPTSDDYKVIIPRIKEKIKQKPHYYRYYGKKLSIEEWNIMYDKIELEA